jgi:hypothetical protein
MSNSLSPSLLAQLYSQESNDPFLTLVTLSHISFSTIRLVNNSKDVVSRGNTFTAFPFKIRLPVDDGETAREIQMEFDNVGLDLITPLRSVTGTVDVNIEMVLASIPNDVQLAVSDLKISTISYNKTKVTAKLYLDNFLNTALTSEKYDPTTFPGLF